MSVFARRIEVPRWVTRLFVQAMPVLVCAVWVAPPALLAQESTEKPPATPVINVQNEGRPGEIYVLPKARSQNPEVDRMDIRRRIERLWADRRTEVRDTGTEDPCPESLQPILESLRQQGYGSVTGMEANLVYEAHQFLELQYLEQAQRGLEAAMALDPEYLPALSARAEVSLNRSLLRVPGHVVAALSSLTGSFWPALTSLTNLALVSALTLLVMACMLQLVLAARYQKTFRHSFYESWRERMPNDLLPMVSWCLFLAPLFLFLGPFWLFCYWTAVLWRFATRVERLLAVSALIILSFLVPAVDTVEDTFRDLNTDDLRLFSEALQQKLLSPRGETLILKGSAGPEPEGRKGYGNERQFLVAAMHQKMGWDDSAFEGYAAIPVYHYLYAMAQNNIGNIYFSMNQFDLSIQHYRMAIDVRPDYAECYFNLSSAQFQVYDFDHSDQSLSRAQRLAPLALGKIINEESRGLRTLDHRLPESFLWDLTWDALRYNAGRHFGGLSHIVPGGNSSGGGKGILVLPAAAMLSALAGLLLGWLYRHEEIAACNSCGRAFCRHCGPDPMKQPHCQQCTQLGSRLSGVSPEIHKKKLSQIRRHQLWGRIREGLLAITIPGLESMRRGKTVTGALVAGSWVFLLTVIFALPSYLPRIGLHTPPWSLDPLFLVAVALLLLFWTVSLVGWVVRVLRSGGWRLMGTLRLASGQTRTGAEEEED